jgi:hypothetical protein
VLENISKDFENKLSIPIPQSQNYTQVLEDIMTLNNCFSRHLLLIPPPSTFHFHYTAASSIVQEVNHIHHLLFLWKRKEECETAQTSIVVQKPANWVSQQLRCHFSCCFCSTRSTGSSRGGPPALFILTLNISPTKAATSTKKQDSLH